MNISSTTRSTNPAPKLQRHGRMAAAGMVAVALLAALGSWRPSSTDQVAQDEDDTTLARPLFAGWIQPGHHNFNPEGADASAQTSPQLRWVLEPEPNEQAIQAIESTLADASGATLTR